MIFPSPCSFSLLLKEPFEKRAIKGEKSKGERDTVFQRKKEREKERTRRKKAKRRLVLKSSLLKRRIEALMCPSFSPQLLFFFFEFFSFVSFRFFFCLQHPKQLLKKESQRSKESKRTNIGILTHTHIQIHIY